MEYWNCGRQDLYKDVTGDLVCRCCGETARSRYGGCGFEYCKCRPPVSVQRKRHKRQARNIKSIGKAMRKMGGDCKFGD